jgi:hypothetical protein
MLAIRYLHVVPDLYIRNLPSSLHARLKAAANAHRRSMTQEAIATLEVGLAAPTKVPPRPLPEPVQLKRPTTMEETLRFIDDGLERRGLSQGS